MEPTERGASVSWSRYLEEVATRGWGISGGVDEPAPPEGTETPAPDDVLRVELPAELLEVEPPEETPPPEKVPPETTEEKPPVETPPAKGVPETPPAPPIPTDGKGGLVPAEAGGLYDAVEQARARFDAEQARLRGETKPEPPAAINYNELEDQNAVMKAFGEVVARQIKEASQSARDETLRVKVHLSQELLRVQTAALKATGLDFDAVIEQSGVLKDIVPDKQGNVADPFLRMWVYGHENPAQAAYEYGKGRLSKKVQADAEVRGEKKGKQAIVEKVLSNANKPRGIAALPSSTPTTKGVTRAQIDGMSDAKKATLKKDHPDVWRWYLGGG